MSNESSMKKCGYCGQTSHASTACNNGKVDIINLFGVRIDPTADQSEDNGNLKVVNGTCRAIHESKSIESLKIYNNEHSCIDLGYSSDGHNLDKRKGMPWTEDEHRSFLTGLQKLGKGQWRAVSKHYVPSRTPTQVASHAQKFFIRLNSTEDKSKLRSSLFDMPLDEYSETPGTSSRPPVAPMELNQTYGVEGYNQFSKLMGYRNHHIPLTNYKLEYPLDQRTGSFATLAPQPLLITNGETERCTTQEHEVQSPKD